MISEDADKKSICLAYEHLSLQQKKGFWAEVGMSCDKGRHWATLHYLSTFRKALYNDSLTAENQVEIDLIIKERLGEKRLLKYIKSVMPQTILPEKIDNYYYKCLSRMKNESETLTVKEESDFTIDERTFYNFSDDNVFE